MDYEKMWNELWDHFEQVHEAWKDTDDQSLKGIVDTFLLRMRQIEKKYSVEKPYVKRGRLEYGDLKDNDEFTELVGNIKTLIDRKEYEAIEAHQRKGRNNGQ